MKLQQVLDQMTGQADLGEKLQDGAVRCQACAHRCRLAPDQRGVCQVRFNRAGELRVPRGYVSSLQPDPIEKKPFYHFLPGADALTFGMLGCNLKCGYCQNWLTSQALREPGTDHLAGYLRKISPEQIVEQARISGAAVIASSYNEPLISSEWSAEIFRLARQRGIKGVFISNGFSTPEALNYLHPDLEGFKVDLKTMQDDHYRELGGRLAPVLESIAHAWELGLWVEIVTLLVPGFNDTTDELTSMAEFIYSISPEIPWHITAFRPQYRMQNRSHTSQKSILEAVELGYQQGLFYVYGGNLPGMLGSYEHTRCHHCQAELIKRRGFIVQQYRINKNGTCPDCGGEIPGIWS